MATTADAIARLRLLHDLGIAFAARTDLDELIPLVMSKCRDVLDAESASVLLLDSDTDELYFPYVAGSDADVTERLVRIRFPAARGIAGEVVRTGQPLRIDDVASDPRFYAGVDATTGMTTRNLVCAPLASHNGTIGTLQVLNRRAGAFDDADLGFLAALAGAVGVAIENARLFARVRDSEAGLRAQVGAFRRDQARRTGFAGMVGSGRAMAEVFGLMESAAASPIAVLVEGETGTGKELVARGIHLAGARADGPFVAVNCAAVPETLLESELFGHRRGAFTGAIQDQRGVFEAASGGTIFLDEIGEMPAAMQAKLLRVLQESEVVPVGDRRPRRVDVRVVSATNRDLSEAIAHGTFRQDLYYRIAAFPIALPPLRERRDDVPLLAARFLAEAAERHRKTVRGFEPAAMAALVAFDWPGNVRELQNEVERAVALVRDGDAIGPAQLSRKLSAATPPPAEPDAPGSDASAESDATPLRAARAAFEARHIVRVLRQHGGNVTRAAEALGLSRFMLQKKMKEYGLRESR